MFGGLNIGNLFSLFSGALEGSERRREEREETERKKREAIADLDARRDEVLSDWYLTTGSSTGETTTFKPQVGSIHSRGVARIRGWKNA
jgi:hypothetical protein